MSLMFLYFLLSLKKVLEPTTPLDCWGGTFTSTSSAMSLSLKLEGEKTWFGVVFWFILSRGSGAHSLIPDLYEATFLLLFILMGSFPEMPEGYFTDATEI